MSKSMIATFNVESGKIMASDPCYKIGVWCQSGYGDGSYDVDAVFEGNEVVALKVTFIYEDEDEDEVEI